MNYKRFPLGKLWTNGYLFWNDNTKNAFFVDPGGDCSDVFKFMKNHSLTPKMVLLTHGHIDHIAGLHEFIPFTGSKIYIHKNDSYMLRQPPKQLQKILNVHCDPIDNENFTELSDENKSLKFDDFTIEILDTPGHTEGSVCYLVSQGDEKVLLSGDTLFAQSVGRTDLEGGSDEKLTESLLTLLELNDDLKVLPGHGPLTTIGDERLKNPFLKI